MSDPSRAHFNSFNYLSVLDAYEARAQEHPERPALLTPTQTLTHAQLWQQAAKMAAGLEASGVGAGDAVGVMLGRTPEHIIAMLASWWLGATFVPIDPALPQARRTFIAARAALKLIISPTHHSPQHLLAHEPHQARVPNQAHELAYIIFTSGSTGQPKGVMVEHRGIYNLLHAQIEAFALRASSRALWCLSPSFDASISDIGTTLCAGACLVILPETMLYPIEQLAPRLNEHQITHLDFPPSLLGRLDPERCASLQTLIIGGEACAPELVQRWAMHKRVINVYGPTEATICTSWAQCDPHWQKPSLGQLIPHMSWSILGEDDEPLATGHAGELVLAGVGLARGYLGDEAQTAARFSQWRGQRIYRTGDRVTRDEHDQLIFLGRLDQQVKLRGQRMELQELELALCALPQVYASAVIKLEAPHPRLVAFVEGETRALDPQQLRRQLALTLPAAMLPSAIYVLDALPRHTNKKLDRGALYAHAATHQAAMAAAALGQGQPASTPQERCLIKLWSEALGVELVSVTQDLLVMGADSMTILSVVARAAAHGIHISPAQWMRTPSIKEALTMSERADEGTSLNDTRISAQALMRALTTPPQPARSPRRAEARRLERALLTGANGHLGVRLLRELLGRTEAKIIAGVRGGSDAVRRARIDEALRAQGQPKLSEAEGARVETLALELGLERFGLERDSWQQLSRSIDTIIHCGARVHMLEGYERLRPINVEGTLTALKLALDDEAALKTLHAISTLSVFVATDRHEGVALEDDDLSQTQWIYGGYAQSKWAAERALRLSAPATLPLSHHRLGLVTADSISGQAGEADFLLNFIRGLSALGAIPTLKDQALAIDISPVDQVARVIIDLILADERAEMTRAQTYHLAGAKPLYLSELFELMRQEGIALQQLEPAAWVLCARPKTTTSPAAMAMLALCRALEPEHFDRYRIMDLTQATRIRFDDKRVRGALNLEQSPIQGASPELIRRYIRATRA